MKGIGTEPKRLPGTSCVYLFQIEGVEISTQFFAHAQTFDRSVTGDIRVCVGRLGLPSCILFEGYVNVDVDYELSPVFPQG